jgi:hypothetical protein
MTTITITITTIVVVIIHVYNWGYSISHGTIWILDTCATGGH